jgi:parallel beta-helix repeat protein
VVTVNDTSGTLAGLQAAIDGARTANPSKVIVIHLKSATTYAVSSTSLALSSHMALVGTGATIQAASASVTVPLISISSGSTKVSVAGGTYDGNGANIRGIYGSGVSRVNIDKVVVKSCGQDGILLIGNGNTMYESEFAVTRSDCSGGSGHAGISIQQCTMAYVGDNNCHDNLAGISLDCTWANVANNVCQNNTTGIDVGGGSDNVVVNNDCNCNATGIHVTGSNNMIASNAMSGNTTVGIASAGTGNNYLDNKFGSLAGNASDFSGVASDNVIAYGVGLGATGQNYFYPPLIDNPHTKPIANGKARTDLTIASTSIANVQTQYNAARSANPSNTIVLHLNGTFTLGAAPLSLSSDTSVLLTGTIQIDSSTKATAAISIGASQRISLSGGTIDGGGLNGHFGVDVRGGSLIQVDKMTIQNLGDNSTHHGGSDSIHFFSTPTPNLVTRCTINKSGARGIWSQTKGKVLYAENVISNTRAGIDCDSSTSGAVMMFNTATSNTYGLWYEQSAQHNVGIGNVANNNDRNQLDIGNLDHTPATEYNSYICNKATGGIGIVTAGVSSDGGTGTTTSHNFLFNNVLVNASITSHPVGTENYYSQNIQSGDMLSTSGVETFFNPAVP